MGFGKIGFEVDCLSVAYDCLLIPSEFLQCGAKVVVCLSVIGSEDKSLSVADNPFP